MKDHGSLIIFMQNSAYFDHMKDISWVYLSYASNERSDEDTDRGCECSFKMKQRDGERLRPILLGLPSGYVFIPKSWISNNILNL